MNLNKYTKAELISKLNKKSDTNKKSDSNNQTIWTKIIGQILIFKNILLKITLIVTIIKFFKKYRFFRALWMSFNSIVMAIFGISLLDNFGFKFISNFLVETKYILWNIVDYFSSTQFYNYLTELFSANDPSSDSENKNRSMIETSRWEAERNKNNIGESKGNSKISEWLNPDSEFNKDSEIKDSEIKEESLNYKKYLIITGLIIGSCFIWVYFDEIKSSSGSLWDWMRSFRAGAPDEGSTDTDSNRTISTTNVRQTSESNLISPVTSPDIELSDQRRLFSSPSIENLNSEASQSWAENLGSPTSSTSSDETVRPQIIITPPLENLLTPIEIALIDKIKLEWKDMIPNGIKARMIFVENQVLLDRWNNPEMKSQMVSYLVDINLSTDKLINQINRLK